MKSWSKPFAGIELIKTMAAEDRQQERMRQRLDEATRANERHNLVEAFVRSSNTLVSGVVVFIVLSAGVYEYSGDRMSMGELSAFLAYAAMVAGTGHALAQLWGSLQTVGVATQRVGEVLQLMPEQSTSVGLHRAEKIRGSVAFHDVSFSYNGSTRALDGVSWTCEPGEVVALVGPSGAGKSTMVSLIIQLYRVGDGRILVDGIDSREWDLTFLRERVGFVTQQVFLLDDTVANNIRFGKPDAASDDIQQAAQSSGAAAFIQKLPQGFDTRIGERGVKLSAGERQRLSLARTLLKNPDLLILNEPTSSVDARTEAEIRETLRTRLNGRTTFIVAHRLSTVKWGDRILVLDEGRVVDQGTHDDLVARCSLYAELWRNQT